MKDLLLEKGTQTHYLTNPCYYSSARAQATKIIMVRPPWLVALLLVSSALYFYVMSLFHLSVNVPSSTARSEVTCPQAHWLVQSAVTAKDKEEDARIPSSHNNDDNNFGNAQRHANTYEAAWWLEDTEYPGWFDRTFVNAESDRRYDAIRDITQLERKQRKNQRRKGSLKTHFHPICGHYRFNETLLPTVSVIITVQDEVPGWLTTTVQSVLARTPPHLLQDVIVVDDNGNENSNNDTAFMKLELAALRRLPSVQVIQNDERQGCAKARLIGAKTATGDVLYFTDSHIEMISSTWYQHLVLPILENPRTMAIQAIEVISDAGDRDYYIPGDASHGIFDKGLMFRWLQQGFDTWNGTNVIKKNKFGQLAELPSNRHPYETPMGPGALFAMRRDEFWRLGGYDEGNVVWGAENIELGLKTWMCGGRVLMVPCSRAGHMFRVKRKRTAAEWLVPDTLANKTGCFIANATTEKWKRMSVPTKLTNRNSLRVVELWVGDHPAREQYYEKHLEVSRDNLPPEWKQYVDELQTDPTFLKQKQLQKENKCRDFAWYDRNVLMKLVGRHNPWN